MVKKTRKIYFVWIEMVKRTREFQKNPANYAFIDLYFLVEKLNEEKADVNYELQFLT